MTGPAVADTTTTDCACCGNTGPTPFQCTGDCACPLSGDCAALTNSTPKAAEPYIVLIEGAPNV